MHKPCKVALAPATRQHASEQHSTTATAKTVERFRRLEAVTEKHCPKTNLRNMDRSLTCPVSSASHGTGRTVAAVHNEHSSSVLAGLHCVTQHQNNGEAAWRARWNLCPDCCRFPRLALRFCSLFLNRPAGSLPTDRALEVWSSSRSWKESRNPRRVSDLARNSSQRARERVWK